MSYRDYTKQYLKEKKVKEYASLFNNIADKVVSSLEVSVAEKMIRKYKAGGRHLDVACGFGRIACPLSKFFQETIAIDTSPHMIKRIRKNCPAVKAQIMDAEHMKFKSDSFGFITMFRFVMNFQSDVRHNIFKELHRVLKPGGILMFNVHLNKWSPRGIAAQLRNRYQKLGTTYMSYTEARRELRKAGFKVLEVRGIKVLPFYKNRIFINKTALVFIERLLSGVPLLKHAADGYVFVCKKD
jgi:ubiquinone/menaquinone biosynthesis C-methylase UbiE